MPDEEAIAAAHEQAVEQVMSDERLLGVLPDDLSQTLLDWVIAQIGRAAEQASDVEAFWTRADAVRLQARALADASADAGDDTAALQTRRRSVETAIVQSPPAPAVVEQHSRPATVRTLAVPETASIDTASIDTAPASEPIRQPPASGAVPKLERPPITSSPRSSFRRMYRRFRSLFRTGVSR